MQTTLTDIPTRDALPMLNAYKYDQLNRLLEARSYETGLSSNVWSPSSYGDEYLNTFTYDANGNILTQNRYLRDGTQTDELTYNYLLIGGNLLRNRLYHVNDAISGATYVGDLEDQGALNNSSDYNFENLNNYRYDQEGRLIQDLAEGIEQIVWRVDGKVKAVNFTTASNKNNLEFDYDAFGRRVAKHVFSQNGDLVKSTYYVLDAQGNQLSTYEHKPSEPPYELVERVIYGSSRLGINVKKVDMFSSTNENLLSLYLGEKLYEMSNHLGNVLTVINDIKVPYLDGSDVAYYATIVSTADYSPFGVQLDGRTESAESYRYGFNGMEKESELKGNGNSYDFGARILDPRLGRWLSRDPLEVKYTDISPYVFAANSVIKCFDPDGKKIIIGTWTNEKDKQAFIADLRGITGLDLYINEANELQIGSNEVVRSKDYTGIPISVTAYSELLKQVESDDVVTVNGIVGAGNQSTLPESMNIPDNPEQTSATINLDPSECKTFAKSFQVKGPRQKEATRTKKLGFRPAMIYFHEAQHGFYGVVDEIAIGSVDGLYGDERGSHGVFNGSPTFFTNEIQTEMGMLIRATYGIKRGNEIIIPYLSPKSSEQLQRRVLFNFKLKDLSKTTTHSRLVYKIPENQEVYYEDLRDYEKNPEKKETKSD